MDNLLHYARFVSPGSYFIVQVGALALESAYERM
jgi:hypothetical protein